MMENCTASQILAEVENLVLENHTGYDIIPDIYTMYKIFQSRKCTNMDVTYPKKSICTIIHELYKKVNNVIELENIVLYIIKIYNDQSIYYGIIKI